MLGARFKLVFFTHPRKTFSSSAEDQQVPLRFGKEQVASRSHETPGGAPRSQLHPTALGQNHGLDSAAQPPSILTLGGGGDCPCPPQSLSSCPRVHVSSRARLTLLGRCQATLAWPPQMSLPTLKDGMRAKVQSVAVLVSIKFFTKSNTPKNQTLCEREVSRDHPTPETLQDLVSRKVPRDDAG